MGEDIQDASYTTSEDKKEESMKIYIQDLLKSPLYVETERPFKAIDTGDLSFSLRDNITVDMIFEKMKDSVLAEGKIEGTIWIECSRCLEEFSLSGNTDIYVRFHPQSNLMGDGNVDLSDRDLNICYYEKDYIDLDDHIRENLILAVPIKPLCGESCQGICSHCGQDLNHSECQCEETEDLDPRMAPLRKLLEN